MIARFNRRSFVFGVPGIALQITGHLIALFGEDSPAPLGVWLMLFGTVLLMIGLAYYAKAKEQSPAWCIAGLLSIIGLLLLLLVEDKAEPMPSDGEEHEKT